MKVKKTSKKVINPNPEVESLVSQAVAAKEEDLPSLLTKLVPPNQQFTYPRADLHAYVPLLDRFDAILEKVIEEYKVDEVQVKEFEQGTKDVVLAILRVERLVLDNTTSRKIFASYDRLQSLLFTSDLAVLHAVILLILRPAQQYSSNSSFELSSNTIIKSRLLRLAEGGMSRAWGRAKEEGWGMKELSKFADGSESGSKMDAVPEDWFNVQLGFYKPSSSSEKDAAAGEDGDKAAAPNAAELEKPTQELRLASSRASPAPADATPTAGNESMSVDSPNVMETPSRPSLLNRGGAAAAGRIRSGLSTSTTVEPSSPVPITPGGNAATTTPAKTPAGSSNQAQPPANTGTLTTSPFSRCFTNSDGHVTLSIPASAFIPLLKAGNKTPMQFLADLVEHHPELMTPSIREELFELLCKLRVVMALRPFKSTEDESARRLEVRQLLEIRMAALATYLHLTTEETAQSDLFLYDTSIIPQLAELTNPANKTDDHVLAATFIALDACARYKSKVSEVLTAVNANVAHGMLLTGFAGLIKRLQADDDILHDLVDAELAFVSYAATTSGYAVMLVGAGILPLLVEFFKIRNLKRSGYVARAIGLIDSILYGNPNAFNIFVNSGGVEALNERVTFEINRALDPEATPEGLTDSEIVRRTAPLKLCLRSLHRMMQASGTSEGLRNLIDSELPKSLKKIFENSNKVGPPSLALAMNVTATFVHNEPTSLAVIQEMKLPQALYDAIQAATKPSFEVLSATTNAIGAMCLNQAGIDLTVSRPEIISRLVHATIDPAYRDILRDRDNCLFLGGALDELARHHPPLKQILLDSVLSMLKKFIEIGQTATSRGITTPADYKLILTDDSESSKAEAETAPAEQPEAAAVAESESADRMEVEEESKPAEPPAASGSAAPVVEVKESETHFDSSLDLCSQLLQGLFHNQGFARDFMKADGHKLVLKLYALPALLAQFATTESMLGLNGVVRALSEANISTMLHAVIKATKKALEACKDLWRREDAFKTSFFATMLDVTDASTLDKTNASFRQIVHLTNILGSLKDLFGSVGFAHGRIATSFLQQIGASQDSTFLEELGALHRVCIWENISLKVHNSMKPVGVASRSSAAASLQEQILSPTIEAPEQQSSLANGASSTSGNNAATNETSTGGASPSEDKPKPVSPNYANVKYLATRIPAFLTPFFQGLIKMLIFKRLDSTHKTHATPTAGQIAQVMLKHLDRAPTDDKVVSRAYDTSMVGLVTVLLFDERQSTSTLQVMLLIAFQKNGGFEALVKNIRVSMDDLDRISQIPADTRTLMDKQELVQGFGHLKMAMDLVKLLVTAKTLFESNQTQLLSSKEVDKESPDYFNPSDFLLSMRLSLFDAVRGIWDAPWLPEAPLALIRSSVQATMSITAPIPEVVTREQAPVGFPVHPPAAPRAPFVVNETHVNTLIEMGFTRHASTIALTRLQNNLGGATEYLLSHAHLIQEPAEEAPAPPAPEPAPEAAPAPAPAADDAAAAPAEGAAAEELPAQRDGDVEMAPAEEAAPAEPQEPEVSAEPVAKADPEADKKRLQELCEEVLKTMPQRAIALVDAYDTLVFDVFSAFLVSPEGLVTIATSLEQIDTIEEAKREKSIFSRLRLLAVVAHQSAFADRADREMQERLMKSLMALLPPADQKPTWMSAYLLCAEALFIWGEAIQDVTLDDEALEKPLPERILRGPLHQDARSLLAQRAVSLLGLEALSGEELLAGLRLLVLLTRDRDISAQIMKDDNLTTFLQAAAKSPKAQLQACQSFVTMIMRHFAEDAATLQSVMGKEIKAWFARPRSNHAQVPHFVSNIRQTALRDPETFLRVVEDECALLLSERSPSSVPTSYYLQLKPQAEASKALAEGDAPGAMQIDDPFKETAALPTATKNLDGQSKVLQFLIGEMIALSKAEVGALSVEEAFSRHCRESTTMLVLTELLGSYIDCKTVFIAPSKKLSKDPSGAPAKHRSAILNTMINHLVCTLVFDSDVCRKEGTPFTPFQKRRLNLSNWSTAAIVALCADVSAAHSEKENAHELAHVRKTVMDAIAKALKDVSSSTEQVNLRYGKLWALCQLCHRLLTARPSIQPKANDESTLQIAKVMLEKSFVPILTTALVDIDLQYPGVKNLVTAILQPLEHLTKLSTRMGKTEKSGKNSKASEDVDMTSESDSDDYSDDSGSEDPPAAPDMYRNSALGMFGGAIDDYMDNSEDEDGQDEDGADEYDDMEDMEDDEDSEGTEPSDEDEDEMGHEMEQWDDVDIEEGMEEGDGEEEEDYGDEDGMAFLADGEADEDAPDMNGDGMEEDGMDGEADDYDEDDIQDEEDFDEDDEDQSSIYHELEPVDGGPFDIGGSLPTAGAMQNWGWAQQGQPSNDEDAVGRGTGHRRGHRHRLYDEEADLAMFGRSRQGEAPPLGAIASHPLLQEQHHAAPHAALQFGGARRALRGLPNFGDLIQSLDQIMGGDAMQMLESLVSRTGHGDGLIRIDLDRGADGGAGSIGIQVGRQSLELAARVPGVDGRAVPQGHATETVPQPTASRWQEEEKIAVPVGGSARIANLANLIIRKLLPEAKRVEAERKKEEELKKQALEKAAEEARKAKEEADAKAKEEEAAAQAAKDAEAAAAAAASGGDVEMADAAAEAPEQQVAPAAEQEAEEAAPRVTIMIHGEEVDITETGIDPEFLEALPDDMRADVVNQHLRERRGPDNAQAGPSSSEISPEFLDALPPDIRAEVIQQEAIEQARRNQAAGAPPAGAAGGIPAGVVDPTAFLATLDPGLRQVVLMEQDEDFLAGLPQGITAGLLGIGGGRAPGGPRLASGHFPPGQGRAPDVGAAAAAAAATAVQAKRAPPRDAIQLLDKSGVASLARLLFFPDIFRKNNLLKILANLCENSKNRGDLVNLLLAVLQEDGGDLTYIEKQTVAKDKKTLMATPKATPRKKNAPDTPVATSTVLGNLQSDSIPAFVAQRAFEGLAFIVQSNEQATLYFLTEHEIPIVARKPTSRKGKGRDKPSSQVAYPIVILMSLLARGMVLETPAMVESLTALLATITRPLSQLSQAREATPSPAKDEAAPVDAAPAASETPATANAAAGGSSSGVAVAAPVAAASSTTPGAAVAEPKQTEAIPPLLQKAPKIPADVLQLVANVLTHGECTSRTFSHTLSLIQHLSYIPEAKESICAELRSQAQSIGDVLVGDLKELSHGLADLPAEANTDGVSMTKFTAASSEQAKLLRILKTIDYMFAPKSSSAVGGWDAAAIASVAEGATPLSPEEESVNGIFETFHFNPVWDALGECLGLVQERTDLISVMTVLLPLVESLMVVSKYSSAKALALKHAASGGSPMSPMSPKENSSDDTFFRFTSSHRKVLNIMVRNNPSLMSGSFSLLVLNSRVLEFDNKRNWFTQQLRKKPNREVGGSIHLTVRRSNVFSDSYRALQQKSGDTMKYGKLNVKFHEEEGVDAGGVTREWYSILAREIFNPGYCLFEPCAADQLTYQPSQHSWVNDEHLSYFRFVGKIIGKAIYDGRLLDAYFSRAFYKQILGRKVDIRDLESVDPEYHKSLVWMLENDITNIIDLDFSLEAEEFGEKKIIDLKPGGSSIPVTEANKEEYVRLVVEHRLETAILKQITAFLDGFYDIIPRKLVSIFDPDQLELLISGISNIDVDELKNATQLHGWKNSDAEISWFWRALRSFSQEERARFLMFVTSSSRVPLGGFSQLQGSSGVQPFQIHKLYREDVLPSSATCFNELLLPSYPSYEALRAKLHTAITEGSGHFGLA